MSKTRPECIALQKRLLEIAEKSRCSIEEVILAGCTLVANTIVVDTKDQEQIEARIQIATDSIRFVVSRALTDTPDTKDWH